MNTLYTLLSRNHGDPAHLGAPEAFVLLTLGFFAGMVVSVLVGAWVLHRRASRPDPLRELMLDLDRADFDDPAEDDTPPQKPKPSSAKEQSKPWEKDGDWWKNADE